MTFKRSLVSNKTNGTQNPINIGLQISLVHARIQPLKPKALAGVTDVSCKRLTQYGRSRVPLTCFESKYNGEKDECTRH